MSVLPRFDSRAKTALATAQQIAIQMSHGVIGSEHLLFGILSQSQDGLPFQIKFIDNLSNAELIEMLSKKGNLDRFQKMTEAEQATFKFGNNFLPEISKELQSCLDVAIRVAEDFNYDYIGLEHLIFGILDVVDSHGKKVIGVTDDTSNRLSAILVELFGNFGKSNVEENQQSTTPQQPPKPKNMNPKSQSALNRSEERRVGKEC